MRIVLAGNDIPSGASLMIFGQNFGVLVLVLRANGNTDVS